jgi:hypothetical protein
MCDVPEREASAPQGWVERYLALLGVEHSAPSPEALARLTRAHVGTILLRERHVDPAPPGASDREAVASERVARRGGGDGGVGPEAC